VVGVAIVRSRSITFPHFSALSLVSLVLRRTTIVSSSCYNYSRLDVAVLVAVAVAVAGMGIGIGSCHQFPPQLGCTLSEILADLFVGSLLPDGYPLVVNAESAATSGYCRFRGASSSSSSNVVTAVAAAAAVAAAVATAVAAAVATAVAAAVAVLVASAVVLAAFPPDESDTPGAKVVPQLAGNLGLIASDGAQVVDQFVFPDDLLVRQVAGMDAGGGSPAAHHVRGSQLLLLLLPGRCIIVIIAMMIMIPWDTDDGLLF